MDSSLNHAVLHEQLLCVKKSVLASLYGKAREFPFDNAGKPDERSYVIEFYRSEAFPCVQNLKACVTKLLSRCVKILLGERQLCLTEEQLNQFAVIPLTYDECHLR